MKTHALAVLGVVAAGLFLAPTPASAGVTEPDTIFYGKIINRTGGPELFICAHR